MSQVFTSKSELTKYTGIGTVLADKLFNRGIITEKGLKKIINELPLATQLELKYPISYISSKNATAITKKLSKQFYISYNSYKIRFPLKIVGSLRRGKRRSKDLDLLLTVPDYFIKSGVSLRDLRFDYTKSNMIISIYSKGKRKQSMIMKINSKYYHIDIFLATKSEFPFALLHHTGSREFNIHIRSHTKAMGLKLNQYGIFDKKNNLLPISKRLLNERDILKYIGVTYKSPSERTK